jgi:hypothetical protein
LTDSLAFWEAKTMLSNDFVLEIWLMALSLMPVAE